MLCFVQDEAEGLDHGSRLDARSTFVGANKGDFLMDPVCLHEFHILWREWFGHEGASRSISNLWPVFVIASQAYRIVLSLRLFKKLKFSGSGKLLR